MSFATGRLISIVIGLLETIAICMGYPARFPDQ
jgi:hypothetical protein